MTDDRPPAETLRAAAERLRQVAGAAIPGPWTATWDEGDDRWSITGAPNGVVCPEVATTSDHDEARYIATMHPGVVLALAAWLDSEADGWDLLDAVEKVAIAIGGGTRVTHSTHTEALAVARAVLGEEA